MSLIEGVAGETSPAVLRSQLKCINAQRRIEFPGVTLKFFEMGEDGQTELLELTEDFCLRRPDDMEGFRENFWYVDILSEALTEFIRRKTAVVKVGDRPLKGVKFPSAVGALSVCTISGELI
jgi:hypothetical protein